MARRGRDHRHHGGRRQKVFDDALPVLQSFSANVIHMGALGQRHGGQAGNNMLSFCNMAALSEGMMLAPPRSREAAECHRQFQRQLQRHPDFTRARWSALLAALLRARPRTRTCIGARAGRRAGRTRCNRAPRRTTCSAWPGAWKLGPDDSSSVLRVYETMLRHKVRSEFTRRTLLQAVAALPFLDGRPCREHAAWAARARATTSR